MDKGEKNRPGIVASVTFKNNSLFNIFEKKKTPYRPVEKQKFEKKFQEVMQTYSNLSDRKNWEINMWIKMNKSLNLLQA